MRQLKHTETGFCSTQRVYLPTPRASASLYRVCCGTLTIGHCRAVTLTLHGCQQTTAFSPELFPPSTVHLCAGKTTLLRYLLENSKEKVACIVNDVASINIDAKLVRNDRNRARGEATNTTADLADTIELANGCACE